MYYMHLERRIRCIGQEFQPKQSFSYFRFVLEFFSLRIPRNIYSLRLVPFVYLSITTPMTKGNCPSISTCNWLRCWYVSGYHYFHTGSLCNKQTCLWHIFLYSNQAFHHFGCIGCGHKSLYGSKVYSITSTIYRCSIMLCASPKGINYRCPLSFLVSSTVMGNLFHVLCMQCKATFFLRKSLCYL